jgi:hypothetical protein
VTRSAAACSKCGFRPSRSPVPGDADRAFRRKAITRGVTPLGSSTSPASSSWSSRPSPS